MPWLIQHRCSMLQPVPSEYAVMKAEADGQKVTRVSCPNPECREEFFVLGHEMFSEAIPDKVVSGLPPGFLIPRSRRTT